MRKKALEVRNSKKFTHAYCREWRNADRTGRDMKSNLFLLFPTLEEDIQNKRVLEIGSGGGGMVQLFRNSGADVTGVDLFREPMVEGIIKGDFMSVPLKGPYDFIFAFGVFENCAIYSPAGLRRDDFHKEMKKKNPPLKMLKRINELLDEAGQCIFQVYLRPLMFTKEMAEEIGFKIRKISRRLDSDKYGDGTAGEYGITVSPEKYYLMRRK
ncbi:methyltransferase domain-containing protein [Candidatus Micrarchaeota archaeon]|nr:methyltransferase domain-containing protein [Candidatus Micrarchaeota archaeon]